MALDPDHAPEAVQLEALVEDQEIVTAELIKAEEDEEEMVTVGAGVEVGVGVGAGVPPPPPPPPPPHPIETATQSRTKHHLNRCRLLCDVMDFIANYQMFFLAVLPNPLIRRLDQNGLSLR